MECYARSGSSGPSVGALVPLRMFRFIGCYFIVAFGVLCCFIMIIIFMIMIIIMVFFIIIIVIITQPLAGHFADRVSQPL